MEIKLNPLPGKVVVKRNQVDEKTESGIIMPGAKSERPEKGIVVAVGPQAGPDAPVFKLNVGDEVVFKKYETDEVQIEGEEFLILDEKVILATITKEAPQAKSSLGNTY